MAALTHLGVGLAAKRIAPKTPVIVLIVAAYAIDFIWAIFYFAGIEHMPEPNPVTTNPWSHGLMMASVWSLLIGLIVFLVARNRRAGWIAGLLVFSHWVIDFISHPMLAAFPDDTKLSLLFDGSPTVGLGLWSTQLGMNIGEYGLLAVGVVIYALTLLDIRRKKKAAQS